MSRLCGLYARCIGSAKNLVKSSIFGRILTTAVCRHPPLYRLAPGSLITVWLLVANITAVRQALVCFAKMNQALNPEGIVDP